MPRRSKAVEVVMTNGWQICRYLGTSSGKELAREPIWQQVFRTKHDAESYWYDSAPGRNDRCTFKRVSIAAPSTKLWSECPRCDNGIYNSRECAICWGTGRVTESLLQEHHQQ